MLRAVAAAVGGAGGIFLPGAGGGRGWWCGWDALVGRRPSRREERRCAVWVVAALGVLFRSLVVVRARIPLYFKFKFTGHAKLAKT